MSFQLSANKSYVKMPIRCYIPTLPIIKAQISGKLVTSGISDVATASVHSEKTLLKKLIMIININRKKRWLFTGARN